MEQKYYEDKRIDPEAMETLTNYDWPGNIRELKNVVERTYHMCENGKLMVDQLPSSIQGTKKAPFPLTIENPDQPLSLKEAVQQFETEYINRMLSQTKTMQECADKLKVNISTLVRKKRHGRRG